MTFGPDRCKRYRSAEVRRAFRDGSITAKQGNARICFSEAAIDAYKTISLHIRQIFAEYTPIIESLSLDKAYLDVTENLKGTNSAIQICDGTGCLDQFPGRTSKGC